MAKAISDEELQLKKRARRRLVGAIALVLLVVVFLPMFLDSEPKPLNQDISINIPPIPNPETTPPPSGPPVVPGMPQQAPAAAPTDAPAAAPAPAPEAPAVVAPKVETPVQETRSSPKATAEPKPAPKPVATQKPEARHAGAEAYVVQLGAFSSAANAKALQKKLQENKFKAYTELVKSPNGDRTRVRVGPYASRDAADKARDQLKSRKLIIGDATVVRQGD